MLRRRRPAFRCKHSKRILLLTDEITAVACGQPSLILSLSCHDAVRAYCGRVVMTPIQTVFNFTAILFLWILA